MRNRVVLFYLFIIRVIFAEIQTNNDIIADSLRSVLIETYGSMKDLTFTERFVIDLGKSTFYSNVNIWHDNYEDISKIEVKLNGQLVRLTEKIYKYSDVKTGDNFKSLLKNLVFLGYKNLDLYYKAIIATDRAYDITDITLDDVDYAVSNPVFMSLKIGLYDEERIIKSAIRDIMVSDKIKNKIGFYIFVYDFLNKIRESIIEKDIESMKLRMKKNNSIKGDSHG